MNYDIKNIELAKKGDLRIEWAKDNMPVLALVGNRFKKERPLRELKISACLHVTTETAVLMEVLKLGGANLTLCASNPLSTQDDVAASIVKHLGVPVFAIKGEDTKTYYRHIKSALAIKPNITMDDGADLVSTIHSLKFIVHSKIIGGTEETTTGVIRLRALAKEGKLRYPIIAVNDAQTKHLFDNRYGTGQSTIDGIMRATNKLLAGSIFVVCGYGFCGKGVALRAKGMGAKVIVVEVEPLRALEATMDGYELIRMSDAAKLGDVFVTTTGDISVIREKHFLLMKDGAIVANSGHFNVEIDTVALKKISKRVRRIRDYVEEYTIEIRNPNTETRNQSRKTKRIYLLGEGRLINLACAEGHPAQVMDMSFANQALSVEYISKNYKKLENKVYKVPEAIDKNIAALKLNSMKIKIDALTKEQKRYLSSWEMGT